MRTNIGNEKPSIHVYYSSMLNDSSFFNPLLYGIEEEGVPFYLQKEEQPSAVELGYQAALDSRLDVGIGIGEDSKIVLHYTKLNKDEPLFEIDAAVPYHQSALGANAARLVKGIPFKSFEEKEPEVIEQTESPQQAILPEAAPSGYENITAEEIKEIVKIVMKTIERLNP